MIQHLKLQKLIHIFLFLLSCYSMVREFHIDSRIQSQRSDKLLTEAQKNLVFAPLLNHQRECKVKELNLYVTFTAQ